MIFKKYILILFAVMLLLIGQSAVARNSITVADEDSWTIRKLDMYFTSGTPRNGYFASLLEKLESSEEKGKEVSYDELIQLLERLEGKQIYPDAVIKYARPKSIKKQKTEHKSYTDIFMKPKRVNADVEFYHKYENILKHAEIRYGVKSRDIVSILMWESGLGEFSGGYDTIKIYLGQLLYMEYARENYLLRHNSENIKFTEKDSKRFEKIKKRAVNNLSALLRMSKLKGIDPLTVKGSWGGAIGYVQFLPVNLKYAVDGDENGTIDLKSWPDAIFSVANYLSELGNYQFETKKRRKAIYRYNPSDPYVDGVILYAETIIKIINAAENNANKITKKEKAITKQKVSIKTTYENLEDNSILYGKVKQLNGEPCKGCQLQIFDVNGGVFTEKFTTDNLGKYRVIFPKKPSFCVNVYSYQSPEKKDLIKKNQNYCTFSKKTKMNIFLAY